MIKTHHASRRLALNWQACTLQGRNPMGFGGFLSVSPTDPVRGDVPA